MSKINVSRILVLIIFLSIKTFCEVPTPPSGDFDLDKELADLGPVSKEVEILPTQIKLPKDAKLTIKVPLLGEITLVPILDEKGVSKGFHVMKPEANKPFVWGPLTIEKGEFKLTEGKLSYVGIVTMFGKRATIGLKDFSLVKPDSKKTDSSKEDEKSSHLISSDDIKSKKPIEMYRLVLGLTFDAGTVALELIPGKKIELKTIDLTFQEGSGISFVQRVDFLGQPVDFSANIDTKNKELTLKAELYECKVVDLVPELNGSLVKDFTMKGLVSINPMKGLIFTGSLLNNTKEKPVISGMAFDQAHIDINTIKKRALISGKAIVLTLPIQAYFAIFLGDTKGAKFAINIPTGVKDWKPFEQLKVPGLSDVTINSIKAGFYTQYVAMTKGKKEEKKTEDKKKEESTLSKVSAHKDFEDSMRDVKGKNEEEKAQKIAKALAESNTFTAGVFDDVVKNGDSVDLTGEKGFTAIFYVSGRSKILNVVSEVMLKIGTAPGAPITLTLFASLPEGWKLSQSFPQIFSTTHNPNNPWDVVCDGIDAFKIDNAMAYAGTAGEEFNGVKIEPGFTIMASVSVDTNSKNMFIQELIKNKIIEPGAKGANLGFVGNFNPTDPKNASFKINASSGGFGIPFGPARLEAARIALLIRARPSIGIGGGFTLIPAKGETPLNFDVDLSFSPIAFGLSMSMQNMWKDPFGVKGFEFGNLAANVTQTYTALVEGAGTFAIATFIPASIGLTGQTKIGEGPCFEPNKPGKSLCAQAGINLGKDISNLALFVDIVNPISIVLLAEILLKQMNVSLDILRPIEQMFPIKVKKGKLYFVPLGTNIGEIKIKQGIGAALYLDLFGREAHVDASIGLDGLTAKGKMPAFDIGIIKMTNFEGTCSTNIVGNKTEDQTCGPTIDIQANAQNIHFIIDGLMQFGPLFKSRTKWYISTKGLAFETETHIGAEGKNLGLKIKGTSISFEDTAKLFALEPKDIGIEIAFEDNLSAYVRESIIRELKSSQKIFEDSINQAMDQVARETVQKDIADQEAAVKAAEGRRVLCKDDLLLCIKREFEVQGEQIKLEALKLKMNFEKTPLGQFFGDLGRKLGFDQIAKGFLMGVKTIGTAANQQTRLVFEDISRLVVIKKAAWKGSLADLGKGSIPGIELIICTGCKEIKYVTPPLNLADPLTSIDAIAKTVVEIIKQVIIGTLRNEKCDNVCGTVESNANLQNTELAKHIAYWNQKGEIDEKGQRYDGDASRGRFLLEELRKTNPAGAAELEKYMLPDVAIKHARLDLLTHIKYWSEKGRVDARGRHYDGDANRGRMLLENLKKLDPAAAAELEPKMLPDPICADLVEHNEYWRARGGKDRDTSGKGQRLLAECKKYSPAFAQIVEKEMLPVEQDVFAPKIAQAKKDLDDHISYWTKNGYTDKAGRHYDGDVTGRGRMLLENLRVLDPAAAAEYAAKMLPDRICGELAKHTDYWRDHGGKDMDWDKNKGKNLLSECRKYSPATAAILEREMVPVG